jgi:hypothetical protein
MHKMVTHPPERTYSRSRAAAGADFRVPERILVGLKPSGFNQPVHRGAGTRQ